MPSLPSFVIAGAPKCGTTALWAYLDEHPEICMSRPKEPRFFSRMEGELERGVIGTGPNRSGQFHRGMEWYRERFSHCRDARAIGEASTYYFAAEDSARLMAEHLPEVRVLIMLRDPVERVYSHFWQEHKLGWELPDFGAMVSEDHPRLRYYCHVSTYEAHLERFLAVFSRDRVLVTLNEDLRRSPISFLRSVCDFVGVDPDLLPVMDARRFNPQWTPRSRGVQQFLSRAQGSAWARSLPTPIRSALGWVRGVVSSLNATPLRYPPLPTEIRAQLVGRFDGDTSYVERLLGRSLEEWRAP